MIIRCVLDTAIRRRKIPILNLSAMQVKMYAGSHAHHHYSNCVSLETWFGKCSLPLKLLPIPPVEYPQHVGLFRNVHQRLQTNYRQQKEPGVSFSIAAK